MRGKPGETLSWLEASAGLGVEHLVKINTFLTDKKPAASPTAPFAAKCWGDTNPLLSVARMIAETVYPYGPLEIEAAISLAPAAARCRASILFGEDLF